jgi:hypothetical protein
VQIIECPACLHFIDARYKNGKEGNKHTRDSLIRHKGGGQGKQQRIHECFSVQITDKEIDGDYEERKKDDVFAIE